jgi:magnesium chelatase subunit I
MSILGGMGSIFRGRQREKPVTPPAVPAPRTPEKNVTGGRPGTIGELRASGYRPVPIKEEMRRNLLAMVRENRTAFPGIIGYDDTVIPQVENAIISGQDIIFLGERGQAKSRIIRLLVNLLDEALPVIRGCEINDNPFAPVCKACREKIEKEGDDTEIVWLPRQDRYGEKLATPDATIADLIGDVDPIKVAEGRYLSDELTIHYGMIPRTNRGIFCINELPDLMERLQVGLFNLMEEADIQIKGYRIRLPLDIFLVASANPEDYTSRGRIITPLKDRFGAQIRTHYPVTIRDEIAIVDQEWQRFSGDGPDFHVPQFMKEIIAEVTHLARKSPDIGQRSGVSVRVSIANQETVVSNAVRRAVRLGEKMAVPRISDLGYIVASTTGKVELESFEDTDETKLIDDLSRKAVLMVFNRYFRLDQLEGIVKQFNNGFSIEVSDALSSKSYVKSMKEIDGLAGAVKKVNNSDTPEIVASAVEFILEGLHLNKRLNKATVNGKIVYRR